MKEIFKSLDLDFSVSPTTTWTFSHLDLKNVYKDL